MAGKVEEKQLAKIIPSNAREPKGQGVALANDESLATSQHCEV